jgi:chromosome partitioning protein
MLINLVKKLDKNNAKAHVIVVGNEKGGSGKTTTAMHLITGLIKLGFSVGSIDIDARQQTLTRYVENRAETAKKFNLALPRPLHHVVYKSTGKKLVAEVEQDEHDRYMESLEHLQNSRDFVVVDTPGSDSFLSRLAHSMADTVITPINDSFVDFDVLAKVDGDTGEIVRPSIYAEMVWNQRMIRAQREGSARSIDWIVMRNRLSHLDAKNKRKVEEAMEKLSRRVGFRIAAGFSERVIYRELFLKGLTLLDIIDEDTGIDVTLSHIAARHEVRELLKSLRLEQVAEAMRVSKSKSLFADDKPTAKSDYKTDEKSDSKAESLKAAI